MSGVPCAPAAAQDIPFIHTDQLVYWKNAPSDTVYVLNFWATWCGPCVEELPLFEQLHRQYAERKVQVILVNTDFKRQVEDKVKPFVQRKNLQARVVFMDEPTPNKWIDLVNPEWSGAIPATLIVSKSRDKMLFFEEQLSWEQLESAVLSVLEK